MNINNLNISYNIAYLIMTSRYLFNIIIIQLLISISFDVLHRR